MVWAIASSIFVIYLYRRLNAESPSAAAPADNVENELAELNASIAALEGKVAKAGAGVAKP